MADESILDSNTTKETWTTALVNNLPNSSFLFVEDGENDSEGKRVPRSKRHLPYKDVNGRVDLPHLRNAISRLGQSGTGKGWMTEGVRKRLMSRAQGILQRQRKVKSNDADGLIARLSETVQGWFDAGIEADDFPEPLSLWKEADGSTRFLAVFSNKYRDDDSPPEILASDAHRDFVKAVDGGEWPHPELWVWHVKGTRYGQTDLMAYDESTGMTIALGVIDRGMEHVAQKCVELGDVMSHGMPASEIRRSDDDPNIIVRYRSNEISTLPLDAAANKRTFFNVMNSSKEAESVKIPDEKVEGLAARGVNVDALTAQLESEKDLAEEEGRDSKEIVDPVVEAEPGLEAASPLVEVKAEEAPLEEVKADAPAPAPALDLAALATQVGQVMAEALKPIQSKLEHLDDELKTLKAQQTVNVEEQKATDEALEALTPAASTFGGLIRQVVIGNTETRVDGRTKEALDGPKETEAPIPSVHGIDFIDKMLSGGEWRDAFKTQ